MSKKRYWMGSQGPFLFDDQDTYEDGVQHKALRAETIIGVENIELEVGTTENRIVRSNTSKELEEVSPGSAIADAALADPTEASEVANNLEELRDKLNAVLQLLRDKDLLSP